MMARRDVQNMEPAEPGGPNPEDEEGGGLGSPSPEYDYPGPYQFYDDYDDDSGDYAEPGGYSRPDGSTGFSGSQSESQETPYYGEVGHEASVGAALSVGMLAAGMTAELGLLTLVGGRAGAAAAHSVSYYWGVTEMAVEAGHAAYDLIVDPHKP